MSVIFAYLHSCNIRIYGLFTSGKEKKFFEYILIFMICDNDANEFLNLARLDTVIRDKKNPLYAV